MEKPLHKSFILCNDRKIFYTLQLNKYYNWKKILTVGQTCDIVNTYNSIVPLFEIKKKLFGAYRLDQRHTKQKLYGLNITHKMLYVKP